MDHRLWHALMHLATHVGRHLLEKPETKQEHAGVDAAAAERERLAREQAERELQEAARRRAIEYEQDRPWRQLRNTGRVAAVGLMVIVTLFFFARSDVCVGLFFAFGTCAVISGCSKGWEN